MITVVILFVVFFIFSVLSFYFYKWGKTFITIKITHWLVAIYVGVLFLATITFPFVSNSKTIEAVDRSIQEEVIDERYRDLQNGEIDEIIEQCLAFQETFEHDGEKPLQITVSNDVGISVFVERNHESHDGEIEAFVFRSALIINEMDFSNVLENVKLKKTEEKLTIQPSVKDVHVSILGPSLMVRQLTGDSMISHSSSSSEGVVYLRVPSDLKVTGDERVFLNFVEK